jgi:hypothetical protein
LCIRVRLCGSNTATAVRAKEKFSCAAQEID